MTAIWPEVNWELSHIVAMGMTKVTGLTLISGLGFRRQVRYIPDSVAIVPGQQAAKDSIRRTFAAMSPPIPDDDDLEYDRYDQDEGGPEPVERMLPGFNFTDGGLV